MSLDLIRVLAALLVFLYHINMELTVKGSAAAWTSIDAGVNIELGQLGTVLFFILSGFTSSMSYERIRNERRPWLSYYKKRLLSILPMFYIAYILAFIALRLPDRSYDKTLVFTIFGMDGYLEMHGVHTCYLVGEWFTGCILLIYVLYPLIHRLLDKWPAVLFALALLLKISALMIIRKTGLTDNDLLFFLPDFIFGALIYKYLKKVPAYAGIAGLAVFIVFMCIPMPFSYRISITLSGLSLFIAVQWLCGLMEQRAAGKPAYTQVKQLFSAIAKYTYAIFLTHHVILSFVLRPAAGSIGFGSYCKLLLTSLIFTALASVSVYGINEYLKTLFARRKKTANA